MSAHQSAISILQDHIQEFVERPHTELGGQPVCPFARRARLRDRIVIVAATYNLDNESAIIAAIDQFRTQDKDVLLIVHPSADALSFAELDELRQRFAERHRGEYDVFTGHPDDLHTLGTVQTRREPFPVLHFIRCEKLVEAERLLGARRLSYRGT